MPEHVVIFGTFDLLHPGHHFVVQEAMKRGSVSIVVARDQSVERIKGRLPAQSEVVRQQALAICFPSVRVLLGSLTHFLEPIRELRPDRIVLGYDQRLPPGVCRSDLPCPIERLPAYEPTKYKSSLQRKKM